jgi:hypothetical protein
VGQSPYEQFIKFKERKQNQQEQQSGKFVTYAGQIANSSRPTDEN